MHSPCPAAHLDAAEANRIVAAARREARGWLPDPSVKVVRVGPTPGRRVVAAVSWEGVGGGMLLLLSCDHRLLATAEVGRVDSLRAESVTRAGAREVVVYHEAERGTGYVASAASLFWAAPRALVRRWTGVVFEGVYPGAFGRSSEERARVEFRAPGRIVRTGVFQRVEEEPGGFVPRGPARPIREEYRWDGDAYRRVPWASSGPQK